MTNVIPDVSKFADGWYWSTQIEYRGPFATEDEAYNDYVDTHECEEE